jgi:hypothetical protein
MFGILPIQLTMSADAFIGCLLVAAALLAGWILLRFERLGPRSLGGAVAGWAVAGGLIVGIPAFVQGVLAWGVPQARLVVVFGLALPIFTYFFLAGAWFMRTLLDSVGGVR